jgi:hypothetical protein
VTGGEEGPLRVAGGASITGNELSYASAEATEAAASKAPEASGAAPPPAA